VHRGNVSPARPARRRHRAARRVTVLIAAAIVMLVAAASVAAADYAETILAEHVRLRVSAVTSTTNVRGTIKGRIVELKKADGVALQTRGGAGWMALALTRVDARHTFTLRWHIRLPRHPAPWITVRFAILHGRHVLASVLINLPRAPIPCQPAAKPHDLASGDGWITGGLYEGAGGPPPGVPPDCSSVAYTVSAINASGQVVARQTVSAWHSYVFVVPAGSYTLRDGVCRGSATVRAGQETRADTRCPPVP
jgi:hypothetical protein